MSRAWPVIALSVAGVLASTGCQRPADVPAGDLPPAYTRDKILDPKLAEVARAFTAWAGEQKVQAGSIFDRVERATCVRSLTCWRVSLLLARMRFRRIPSPSWSSHFWTMPPARTPDPPSFDFSLLIWRALGRDDMIRAWIDRCYSPDHSASQANMGSEVSYDGLLLPPPP